MSVRRHWQVPPPRTACARAVPWGRVGFTRSEPSTTRQELLRARRALVWLGLAGTLDLGAFGYFDLHHHTPLEVPVFFLIFGVFIACGAWISNALRCPDCGLHQFCNEGVARDLHFCPRCGADFNSRRQPPARGDAPAGR